MVETPRSSDPGPDQGGAEPSESGQPAASAAAPSSPDVTETVAAPDDAVDSADTGASGTAVLDTSPQDGAESVTETVLEAVTEVVSGSDEAIEALSATEISPPVVTASLISPPVVRAVDVPSDVPSIAATLEVPPREPTLPDGEGGEWELLVGKVNAWFASGELQSRWQQIRGPLKGVAILIAVLLALRVYASVVGTIDGIPLVSGLLELTGLIALVRFALTKLIKTSERQKVLSGWKRRWDDFRGGA